MVLPCLRKFDKVFQSFDPQTKNESWHYCIWETPSIYGIPRFPAQAIMMLFRIFLMVPKNGIPKIPYFLLHSLYTMLLISERTLHKNLQLLQYPWSLLISVTASYHCHTTLIIASELVMSPMIHWKSFVTKWTLVIVRLYVTDPAILL